MLPAEAFSRQPRSRLPDGRPVFLDAVPSVSDGENTFKNFFKRWPGLYGVLVAVVGPSLFTGLTSRRFARTLPPDALLLHAGSGPHGIGRECVDVDIFPFPGVDVIADLTDLPFRDGTFDAATCEQVLEHLPDPRNAAAELLRVVKPGGLVHVATPFVFPWHPSPSDFSRWTQEGLASLFPGCAVDRKGLTAGPFSAFVAFGAAFIGTVFSFGSVTLQGVLQYLFLILLAPFKLLDFLFARLPNAQLCAANVYVVVRKP